MIKSGKQERDEVLFRYYVSLLRGHGEHAKYVPKKELYRQTAKPFFISPRRVQGIISDLLQRGDRILTVLETEEDLKLVLEIHGIRLNP